ncbi:MAG: RagB/SusD family nutrient uptake outer membrane protein [Bacteroidota bacterium]|nr:RagB/SusD family nutrient uptake outer membrane protein [Bacteroidota bacterium]
MKQIFFIIISVLLLSSCKDYLEVKSQSTYSDDVVFSDASLAESAIMGIYNVFGDNNSYRNRLWLQMGENTDCEFRPGATGNTVLVSSKSDDLIPLYSTNSDLADGYNNSDDANPWSRIYSGIERANLCIAGIRKYGSPTPGSVMGDLLGEALTLRAFFYYDLIKWWGDVPFRTEPLNQSNMYIAKTPRATIYTQIIADLGESENLMFDAGTTHTATVKRLSKDAVRGLRARMCLSAAGYAMHPDSVTRQAVIRYTFKDEATRRNFYTIARDECKAIIAAGRYSLADSFRTIFYEQCQDIETHGREAIFELPYNIGVRGRMLYWFGQKHAADNKYTSVALGGNENIMPSFYYDYNDADTRKNVTALPYQVDYTNSVIQQTLTNITTIQFGKWRAEWSKLKVPGTDDGISPIVLRYADVLLMYAEADLYLGGTDGQNYFNMVRRRAFGKPVNTVSSYDLPLNLENLKRERAFELCGENIRKYDLIRWGELKTRLDSAKIKMANLRDGIGQYANVPQYVYTKSYVKDASTGEKGLIIYGLKRGETIDKTVSDPTGGWTKVLWAQSTASSILRLNDTWINSIYLGNPDQRQLLPIMSIVISSSQGKLSNDYGYNN